MPSNYWRAGEIVAAVGGRDVPEARELADAYRAELAAAGEPGGPPPLALP